MMMMIIIIICDDGPTEELSTLKETSSARDRGMPCPNI